MLIREKAGAEVGGAIITGCNETGHIILQFLDTVQRVVRLNVRHGAQKPFKAFPRSFRRLPFEKIEGFQRGHFLGGGGCQKLAQRNAVLGG